MIQHAGDRCIGLAHRDLGPADLRIAIDQGLGDIQRQRLDQETPLAGNDLFDDAEGDAVVDRAVDGVVVQRRTCLLYTSDAADE